MTEQDGSIPKSAENVYEADEVLSGYDHRPLFEAYAHHQDKIEQSIAGLLSQSEAEPIEVLDSENSLLLSEEEIAKIWGLFPQNARLRAVPRKPIIKTREALWFAKSSSTGTPQVTDRLEDAISSTSNAMGNVAEARDSEGHIWYELTLLQIPDNGYNPGVRKIAQTKVLVHELAHSIVDPELLLDVSNFRLKLDGEDQLVHPSIVIEAFGHTAEDDLPISHYSSAYRNEDGTFPEDNRKMAISEELVESITAYILGFVVNPVGISAPELTFRPFEGKEPLKTQIRQYLEAERVVL
jgi:hypothetical protein